MEYTSTDKYCQSCHVHDHAVKSWKLGKHYNNGSGVVVGCSDCHLPPSGAAHYAVKIRSGIKDIYQYWFGDLSKIDWEQKATRQYASGIVFEASCLNCHKNLFPLTLSEKGSAAHLYYEKNNTKLRCINCHLHTGHFRKNRQEKVLIASDKNNKIFASPAEIEKGKSFTEKIPGTAVKFDMIALKGGTFFMGTPEDEEYSGENEHPQIKVSVDPFWIGKYEVSWDEYSVFYRETMSEGRMEAALNEKENLKNKNIDAITGPTPPYGNPDQGWGKGRRPAITMTHYAAQVYCRWLSLKTGKKYRLPTEAEWEYACRGGTESSYFFEGSPDDYEAGSIFSLIFGADTSVINRYVVYKLNSGGKTAAVGSKKANPFGLYDMLGNVKEFCSDYYSDNIYKIYHKTGIVSNPHGPRNGDEFVVRGGSFLSDAADVRCAVRSSTKTNDWKLTDPQIPKSIWWYSDCSDVGFRVVCEGAVEDSLK
jgi:formylglycine-generating enzyme required for sulfatase activity